MVSVELKKGEVLRARAVTSLGNVKCVRGSAWVTQSKDEQDYLVLKNQKCPVFGRRMVLIEALEDSTKIKFSGLDSATIVGH